MSAQPAIGTSAAREAYNIGVRRRVIKRRAVDDCIRKRRRLRACCCYRGCAPLRSGSGLTISLGLGPSILNAMADQEYATIHTPRSTAQTVLLVTLVTVLTSSEVAVA